MLLLIKPTLDCNGACVYCSSTQTNDRAVNLATRLERPLLRVLYERVVEHIKGTGLRHIRMLWHGGEPLLLGADYYREVLQLNGEYLTAAGVGVDSMMQSNLTLLTAEYLPVLTELLGENQLSTSYDPIADVRRLKRGKDYRDQWLAAAELAREGGIRLGMVYVVHREALGHARDLYYFFKNLGLIHSLRFNPLQPVGRARGSSARGLAITSKEWGRFLVELWDAWNDDGRSIPVEPLHAWDRALHTGRPPTICDAGGRCPGTIFGIDPSGGVHSCGRSMDSGLEPLANIETHSLGSAMSADIYQELERRRSTLAQGECSGCRWWWLCAGGCPNDAYQYTGDLMVRTNWCEGRMIFFVERLAYVGRS